MWPDGGAGVLKRGVRRGYHMRRAKALRWGQSTYFGHLNCGKQRLAIDLKTAEGCDIAVELAAASDVVLENFRPGVMNRLKLDYATLASKRPDLIYCSISGFGQTGPRAAQPAYSRVLHAPSGFDQTRHFHYQGDPHL